MYKQLKNKVKYFVELGRYDKIYGALLLMWPCFWGSLINHEINSSLLNNLFLFFLGSFIMRGAGCTINDIVDAPIDLKVSRTKDRPIASGKIKKIEAYYFLLFQLFLGLIVVLNFDFPTIMISIFIVPFVFLYPFVKKFSNYPQLFLGFIFNWGIIVSYFSVHKTLDFGILYLYSAGIFFTLGYDTVYAFQDVDDDRKLKIGSMAVKFKNYPKTVVFLSYLVSTFLFVLSFITFNMQKDMLYLMSSVISAHFLFQVIKISLQRNILMRIFVSNVYLGLIISTGLFLNSFIFFE